MLLRERIQGKARVTVKWCESKVPCQIQREEKQFYVEFFMVRVFVSPQNSYTEAL